MASQDPRLLHRGQDHASGTHATCPYCRQPLATLAPDSPTTSGVRALGSGEDLLPSSARSACPRCRIMIEGDARSLALPEEDRRRVLLAGYRARRAHDRCRLDHHQRYRAVSELAEAFVGLHGAPGVRPFAARALHAWALEQPLDAATRCAVAFILHVAEPGARWELRFEVMSAMRCWDTAQRAVFVEWARRPWWA